MQYEPFEPEFAPDDMPDWVNSEAGGELWTLPPDGQQAFIIARDHPPISNKKDALEIKFSSDLKFKHFAYDWCPETVAYRVENRSKPPGQSVYEVYFYRSKSGEVILATCNCVARVVCKHIARAWERHVSAEETGFIPKL